MKQYTPQMFNMSFPSGGGKDFKRFQKFQMPNNWEVVLEYSMREDERDLFNHVELCSQIHIFKINTCEVFAGSPFDRIHVYSGKVCVHEPLCIKKTLHLDLKLAKMDWERSFPLEAAKEKDIMEERNKTFTEEALEQIETVVKSVSKKDPSKLKKSDFAFISVASNGNWQTFYPTINMLIDYHLEKPLDDQSMDYLRFLESDTFKNLREEWNTKKGVTPGE